MSEGGGAVGQIDRMINVQMTYVRPYFRFENSFEMIIIRYIGDIMNIHRPIFFITADIINLDRICRWCSCFFLNY